MESHITEENFNTLVDRYQNMSEQREANVEARQQYCEENDCPNFDGGNSTMMHRGMRGQGMGFGGNF